MRRLRFPRRAQSCLPPFRLPSGGGSGPSALDGSPIGVLDARGQHRRNPVNLARAFDGFQPRPRAGASFDDHGSARRGAGEAASRAMAMPSSWASLLEGEYLFSPHAIRPFVENRLDEQLRGTSRLPNQQSPFGTAHSSHASPEIAGGLEISAGRSYPRVGDGSFRCPPFQWRRRSKRRGSKSIARRPRDSSVDRQPRFAVRESSQIRMGERFPISSTTWSPGASTASFSAAKPRTRPSLTGWFKPSAPSPSYSEMKPILFVDLDDTLFNRAGRPMAAREGRWPSIETASPLRS